MPRAARVVVPACPHHITQRGNNHQDVFFGDDDRRAYLDLVRDRCTAACVEMLGYCLMTNHVHLLAVPRDADSLAQALGRTHFAYTQYLNRRYGRSGHLWQNRFYSCVLDERHTWTALCYMERNPVRAGFVRRAWRYPWSSVAADVGEAADESGLLRLDEWRAALTPTKWRPELTRDLDDAAVAALHALRASAGGGFIREQAGAPPGPSFAPARRQPAEKAKGREEAVARPP